MDIKPKKWLGLHIGNIRQFLKQTREYISKDDIKFSVLDKLTHDPCLCRQNASSPFEESIYLSENVCSGECGRVCFCFGGVLPGPKKPFSKACRAGRRPVLRCCPFWKS